MGSGAIASFDSRSDSGPELSPGLGFPTATAQSAERTEPVGFFPLLREGGRRGLGLGADCRFLLRDGARVDCPLKLCDCDGPPSSPVSASRTSESLMDRV